MVKIISMRRCVALAVIGCAVKAQVAQTASTCKTLTDSDNNFITSLLSLIGADSSLAASLPLDTIFAELDTTLPWLSTCAAAIDVKTIASSVGTSSSLQSCIEEVESLDLTSEDLNVIFTSSICPTYKGKIIACGKSAMSDIVVFNLDNTDGCCDAFQTKITELFSDSIDVMVEKLLQFIGNAACSQRTFTDLQGTGVTEMCGYSIVNSFGNFESADMTDLLQIPNAGMCDAFEGKSFTNTKGGTSQFAFNVDGVDSMGICVQPVDALLTHLRTWPIFQLTLDGGSKGTFSLKDWFSSGTSITGDKLIAWAVGTDNLPMIIVRTLDEVISSMSGDSSSGSTAEGIWGDYASGEEYFNALADEYSSTLAAFATHIPNSAGCTFSSQKVSEPYTVVSTGSVNGASSVRAGGRSSLALQVTAATALLATAMMLA
jgi:hypothetical protein